MSLDCLKGTTKAFDSRIHKLRPHKGQMKVAQRIRTLLHSELYPSQIAGTFFLIEDADTVKNEVAVVKRLERVTVLCSWQW